MFLGINILALVPCLVGAAVAIVCVVQLARTAENSTQVLVALIIGAALCGSSVFSQLTWDGTKFEVKTALEATSSLADVVKDNSETIKVMKATLGSITQQLGLLTTAPIAAGSDATGDLAFPSDSAWSNFGSTDFCTKFPAACSVVSQSGSSVIVPRSTIESLGTYNEGLASDLNAVGSTIVPNIERLDSIQTQIQQLQAQ